LKLLVISVGKQFSVADLLRCVYTVLTLALLHSFMDAFFGGISLSSAVMVGKEERKQSRVFAD
jgi:hypothetical protein